MHLSCATRSALSHRLTELETEARCGAAHGELSPERHEQHNGDRDWETRAGTVEFRIPELRRGSYFPSFLNSGARRKGADGRDPRSLRSGRLHPQHRRTGAGHGRPLCVSKSEVNRWCAELDERLGAFLSRRIEGNWPYLWPDAAYAKAQRDHRFASVAVIVAAAVNTDGRREVLGMATGNSKAETF